MRCDAMRCHYPHPVPLQEESPRNEPLRHPALTLLRDRLRQQPPTCLAPAEAPEVLLQLAVLVNPARIRDGVVPGAAVILVPVGLPKSLLEATAIVLSDGESHPASLLWSCCFYPK